MKLYELQNVIPCRAVTKVVVNTTKYIGTNIELISKLSSFRYKIIDKIIADKDMIVVYID